MTKNFPFIRCVLSIIALLTAASCGKSVNTDWNQGDMTPVAAPDPNSIQDQCDSSRVVQWNFVQPQPTFGRSVDLLFVVDTSASLTSKRARLAATIPAFINQLTPGTDYRIAVMLAHGGASYYSGRLFADSTTPLVLNSQIHSIAEIQTGLSRTLAHNTPDVDEAGGEMMMYSLLKSLEPSRFAAIQSQGFYRNGAALSVVFITDENDICFRPELNGYAQFPDYVPAPGGSEVLAYNRYCLNSDRSLRVTPSAVFTALTGAKAGHTISLGGIVHSDPTHVPSGSGREDAIGHGIIELVSKAAHPVTLDVMNTDYSLGLAELGNVVDIQLRLGTLFRLTGAQGIDERTIRVRVDGTGITYRYNASVTSVQINPTDAGHAGSLVNVSACRL